jgi:membrane fusion protein (multidrug efflux system)
VSSAEAQIASAKASLLRAKAEAQKATLDLKRAEQLRKANAIPQERLDNARIENDAAQAAMAQANAQLRAAEEARSAAVSRLQEARGRLSQTQPIDQQIAAAKAQADLAHARVKAAQAALTLAQNQMAYTKVVAPADGIVSRLSAHAGQLLQAGQSFAELVPDDTYVIANFKETQIGDMHPGEKVEISIDAYPGKTLEGRVTSMSGGTGSRFALIPPDNASGNFVKVVQRVPVRIDWVKVPDGLPLRAGLSADVTVYLDTNIPAPGAGQASAER